MEIIREGRRITLTADEISKAAREHELSVLKNKFELECCCFDEPVSDEEIDLAARLIQKYLSEENEYSEVFDEEATRASREILRFYIKPRRNFDITSDGIKIRGKEELYFDAHTGLVNFRGSSFKYLPCEGAPLDEDLAWKLNELKNELEYVREEIKFPLVQIWQDLETWKEYGYQDKELEILEKTLEDSNFDQETCGRLYYAYKHKEFIDDLYKIWPNRVEKICSFDKKDCTDKKLIGTVNVLLKNEELQKIKIEAYAREDCFFIEEGTSPTKEWKLSFCEGKFSNKDKHLIEKFFLQEYPLN